MPRTDNSPTPSKSRNARCNQPPRKTTPCSPIHSEPSSIFTGTGCLSGLGSEGGGTPRPRTWRFKQEGRKDESLDSRFAKPICLDRSTKPRIAKRWLLPLSLDSCNSLNSSNSFFDPFSIRAHTHSVSADITFRKQTRADYEMLPPGSPRFQLIDGELHMSPSPDRSHQILQGQLYLILANYLKENPIGVLFLAPFDLFLL